MSISKIFGNGIQVHMTLNLTITNPNADYGRYHCVSKNEMGITRGEIDVYGAFFSLFILVKVLKIFTHQFYYITKIDADPRYSGQPTGGTEMKTWGPSPPDMVDLEVPFSSICLAISRKS